MYCLYLDRGSEQHTCITKNWTKRKISKNKVKNRLEIRGKNQKKGGALNNLISFFLLFE